jgi:PleD family two-component response regulator
MQVTVSAGVTTLRADETAENFLARADSALYAAKARGRNRIASA